MKLVLFRHGDKAFNGTDNPPLSEVGHEQASSLAQMVAEKLLPTPHQIWVSPKIRTQQTMQVLADQVGVNLKIAEVLNEKQEFETVSQFRQRIEKFTQDITKLESEPSQSDLCIYLCSHFDWIEEFLIQLPADTDLSEESYLHWASAQYMVFQVRDGLFELKEFKRVEFL